MGLLSNLLVTKRRAKAAQYIQGDVLELGCGNTPVLEFLSPTINSYCGIAKSARQIEMLKQRYPAASFFQRDLDSDQLDINRKFDCIVMLAVIEHLFNQKFVMKGVAQVLKPGGVVVITTPTTFGNDVVHPLAATIGLAYKSADNDHIVIYNRHRFKILAEEVGLKLITHQYFQVYCNQIAVLQQPGA